MIDLEKAIARMDQRIERLQDTAPFFRQHAAEWRSLAAATVRIYGRPLRPVEIAPEAWENYLGELAERVGLFFVVPDQDGPGVDIDLDADAKSEDGKRATAPVTMADALAWVMAGAEGDENGKNLTQEERSMDPEAVASRVFFARRRGARQLDRPIRKFLEATQTKAAGNILDAILKAWMAELRPRIAAQWREWVRQQVRLEGK